MELLFWAWLDFFWLGRDVLEEFLCEFWRDWVYLFGVGVEIGQMFTIDGFEGELLVVVKAFCDDCHWVYYCMGELCRVCGIPIAIVEMAGCNFYWCSKD